uniref:Uncharacterized protein n=1 Tax=Haptolina ericina TaxID=156174 RepID=A0A7S3C0P5_9EUKA
MQRDLAAAAAAAAADPDGSYHSTDNYESLLDAPLHAPLASLQPSRRVRMKTSQGSESERLIPCTQTGHQALQGSAYVREVLVGDQGGDQGEAEGPPPQAVVLRSASGISAAEFIEADEVADEAVDAAADTHTAAEGGGRAGCMSVSQPR